MKKRKIDIQINNFPKAVQTVLRGAEIFDTSCRSGATVLYSDQGYYIKIDEKDYLVTKAAAGEDATHWRSNPEHLCEVLANAMKQLHGMSIDGVSVSPCMEAYGEQEEKLKCDTMLHGDFCLPNVMMNDGQFQAFIDVGQAGIGDRHIDIFWGLWSLEYNLKTDKYRDYFLELYGREYVDMDILALVETVEMR